MKFSFIIVSVLLILGVAFGEFIWLSCRRRLVMTLAAGSSTFCAMGVAIGYFAGPTSAPAIVNLIYLPLSFASGLDPGRHAAVVHSAHCSFPTSLPSGPVGAGRGWVGNGSAFEHWEALGFTLIFLGIARIGFQRDEGNTYG